MADPREALTTYRDALKSLRKGAGPLGVVVTPLQLGADVLDQLLKRQQDLEQDLGELRRQFETLVELARDGPATLRTQSKAFSAAATALDQAADAMNVQADLLERTGAVISAPARAVKRRRPPAVDKS